MARYFEPVTEVLMRCNIKDIRGELRSMLSDSQRAERLHREIGLSLYQVSAISEEGKFGVDEGRLRRLGDERTETIINNLMDLTPDWFV